VTVSVMTSALCALRGSLSGSSQLQPEPLANFGW
jgi:hypothetical protein